MTLDWVHFTPASAATGGVLIGLAAAVLVLFNGRIAGISGIVGGLLRPVRGKRNDIGWRCAFVAGLLVAPLAYGAFAILPPARIEAGNATLLIAGLLVGAGTRFGSGCTSGHGVCGLSRFSPRSLAATAIFMGAGFATVYVVRHLIGA